MINHREKLMVLELYLKPDFLIKKTTGRPEINVKSADDEYLIAKVDYEMLRAVVITKDAEQIQAFIECLERCEDRFKKELKNVNEFTVV